MQNQNKVSSVSDALHYLMHLYDYCCESRYIPIIVIIFNLEFSISSWDENMMRD